MGKWIEKIRNFIERVRRGKRHEGEPVPEPEEWPNPYISGSRSVIEQILLQKGLDYRRFRPIILDTDCPDQKFGEVDDVDQVLDQLAEGLNFLEISTDRPDHFAERKNQMEQEYGLMVRVLSKSGDERKYGNIVLDFERHQPMWISRFEQNVLYLPFYKRRWIPVVRESAGFPDEETYCDLFPDEENLDIKVPIGYNMVIVKVDKKIFRQDV